jgi:glyoxylase-like metal-dependent hydrolase (beta-lactamase superfamily II)
MKIALMVPSALLVLLLAAVPTASAQMGDPSKVTLKTSPVAGSISVIEGEGGFAGGNVAVSVGDDGMFIVDDEIQPLTPKLKAALAAASKKPLRFVINTHWHADHTGGNGAMAAAGAVIIAHDNVRKRLSVDGAVEFMGKEMKMPALPPAALPVVTFSEDVTLHLNGDEVHVIHVPPAHTDGDAIVHFTKANVIHTGDVFVAGYPLIDARNGGQFGGFITAAERILALCDDATKIIPGHGPVMGRADVQAYHDMLVKVRDRVASLAGGKKSLDDIKAAKLTAEFDPKFGQGFIKGDQFVEVVYRDVQAHPPAKADTGKRRKK